MQIENAKIESTHLGFEDHGILTARIQLGGPGWGQGFGGLCGSHTQGAPKPWRHVASYPVIGNFVIRLLETLGLERWEDLPGKFVRVRRGERFHDINAIGHPLEDRWFALSDLQDFLKTFPSFQNEYTPDA